MFKDDYGNINCADEIQCPYCGYEYLDSFECIPNGNQGDEVAWDQECDDCGKYFRVVFDLFNQSHGYECNKICKSHNFQWKEGDSYTDHDTAHYISNRSKVYRCSDCGEIDFRCVDENGREYTAQEINKYKQQKRQQERREREPEFIRIDDMKKKKVSIYERLEDMYLQFDTDKPEGNSSLFWRVLNKLKDVGFSCEYKGQYKSLKRSSRYLKNDWIECNAEFSRGCGIVLKFYHSVVSGSHKYPEYNSEKYNLLDNKHKTKYRSIARMLKNYVLEICDTGYRYSKLTDSHGYPDVGRSSCKYPGREIERITKMGEPITCNCSGKDRDGKQVHNGDYKLTYNDKGILTAGRAYDRCGTYKYFVHNDRTYSLVDTDSMFDPGGDVQNRILKEKSLSKVKSLLEDAVKEEDFQRCIILKRRCDEIIKGVLDA